MKRYVLDTNIYIEAMRSADARKELAAWQRSMGAHIHQHSVVIAELLVGARDGATWKRWHDRWVLPAERVRRIFVPDHGAWLRASRIISRLTESGRISPGGVKQSFFNDCLLAATAREQGHVIVTHNTRDFELITRVEPGVRVSAPFP